jgi:hypothetical protein
MSKILVNVNCYPNTSRLVEMMRFYVFAIEFDETDAFF